MGHSANAASVMYATLTTGTTNRAMAVADLNVPDSDTGACGLHAASFPRAGVDFSPEGISGGASSLISGYQEQGDPYSTKQAALNAVLANWSSTTDFPGQVARILDDGQSKNSLHRAGPLSVREQDEFWSSIGGTTGLDKIITQSGELAQP
jgi:hypothetical protein